MTITGRQIREARSLLGINRSKLAKKAGTITTRVVMRAEEDDDAPVAPQGNAIAIRRALERAGIEFLPESGSVRRGTQMLDETMPEAADPTLIQMTAEVVAAYVTKNHVRVAELPNLISTIHASLAGMGSKPEAAPEPTTLVPAVPIKKSVTDEFIISLEDGRKLRSMKRYLSVLGMTPEQYRAKWDLPKDYPMVSPAYARSRSALAKEIGLGRKG